MQARNMMRDIQNPNILVPPVTDEGMIPNLRFSFSDAPMKLDHGGWSREITVRQLPISTAIAGVNMSLTAGGVRELHWHKQAEWAYMLLGRARITAVDQDGRNFIADVVSWRPLVLPGRNSAFHTGIGTLRVSARIR